MSAVREMLDRWLRDDPDQQTETLALLKRAMPRAFGARRRWNDIGLPRCQAYYGEFCWRLIWPWQETKRTRGGVVHAECKRKATAYDTYIDLRAWKEEWEDPAMDAYDAL